MNEAKENRTNRRHAESGEEDVCAHEAQQHVDQVSQRSGPADGRASRVVLTEDQCRHEQEVQVPLQLCVERSQRLQHLLSGFVVARI